MLKKKDTVVVISGFTRHNVGLAALVEGGAARELGNATGYSLVAGEHGVGFKFRLTCTTRELGAENSISSNAQCWPL